MTRPRFQTFDRVGSSLSFPPEEMGLIIPTPYTTHEENVNALTQKQSIAALYAATFPLTYGYFGAFGAMWRYKGHQLAQYALLLYRRGSPATLTAYFIMQKLKKKDTGFPPWWGTPEIHESHQKYLETGDTNDLLFPYPLAITRKKS